MDIEKTKVYVITGATSGIGRALVSVYSECGIVFAGYRNPVHESELNLIKNVIPFFIDMEKPYTITGAAEFIRSKTNHVDVLINGAGCVIAGAMENMDTSRLRRQFEINTFSHFEFTKLLIPILDNAKVINISSMASFGIFPFIAPYCASKRALDILFNSMEIEMRSKFKVVSVKPGVIATPLWEKSVTLNKSALENDIKYSKEMNYMAENARKNAQKGLSVDAVVSKITKIIDMQNPKSSYTIGKDAFFAELLSKLPQSTINSLIKFSMKCKFK